MNIQLSRTMLGTIFAILLPLNSFGQQATATQSRKLGEHVASSLGNTKKVHQRGNLFFAGQYIPEDMEAIKEQKITRVITLRADGEVKWDEAAALKAANMEFIKIPFGSPEALADKVFDKVRELLKDKSQPTLLHCGFANRVRGVWIPYRVLDEGADLKTAVKESDMIGLYMPFVKEKALDYVKRKQAQLQDSGKASVKPGIDKKFIDPNLNVDSYVKWGFCSPGLKRASGFAVRRGSKISSRQAVAFLRQDESLTRFRESEGNAVASHWIANDALKFVFTEQYFVVPSTRHLLVFLTADEDETTASFE